MNLTFDEKWLAEWQLGEMYAIMDHYRVPHQRLSEIFPLNGKNE